jgi:CBS domain containing-hemolysin-like protein
MFMLRKVPKQTDSVEYEGMRFEVLDVDHHRIDQILVKRLDPGQKALGAATPAAH